MENTDNRKHLRDILKHLIIEPEGFTPEHAANGWVARDPSAVCKTGDANESCGWSNTN